MGTDQISPLFVGIQVFKLSSTGILVQFHSSQRVCQARHEHRTCSSILVSSTPIFLTKNAEAPFPSTFCIILPQALHCTFLCRSMPSWISTGPDAEPRLGKCVRGNLNELRPETLPRCTTTSSIAKCATATTGGRLLALCNNFTGPDSLGPITENRV